MSHAVLAGRASSDTRGPEIDPLIEDSDDPESTLQIEFTREELEILKAVAHHYERVMGAARYVVVATSPSKIRRRYRHIAAESDGLESRVDGWLSEIADEHTLVVSISLAQVVSFWGRLLSNLNTRRSRRRLSDQEATAQEAVANRLAGAVVEFAAANGEAVRETIETRRRREREWMDARLASEHVVHGADIPDHVAQLQHR